MHTETKRLTINLGPDYHINIEMAFHPEEKPFGSISSNLKADVWNGEGPVESPEFDAAIDGMESLLLSLAIQGVDVTAPVYVEAILSTLDGIVNNLGG